MGGPLLWPCNQYPADTNHRVVVRQAGKEIHENLQSMTGEGGRPISQLGVNDGWGVVQNGVVIDPLTVYPHPTAGGTAAGSPVCSAWKNLLQPQRKHEPNLRLTSLLGGGNPSKGER